MSKKKIMTIIVVAIIIIGTILFISVYNEESAVARRSVNKNWNISLPSSCSLIYSEGEDRKTYTQGEMFSYKVFTFSDEEKVKKICDWQLGEKNLGRDEMLEILENLPVDSGDKPTFDQEYYAAAFTRRDESQMFMIYSPAKKEIYVAQHFK